MTITVVLPTACLCSWQKSVASLGKIAGLVKAPYNSRKSVRWSAVPVAPVFVYVTVMVRGAAAPKGPMTYAQ